MAPAQTRKRKSDEMATPEATTPTGNTQKRMKITETQKQALIDNLQLEMTERARRLRAQYALQCRDLRTRIERRVNRIPLAMRNMTMAELMENQKPTKPAAAPSLKVHDHTLPTSSHTLNDQITSPIRITKPAQTTRNKKRKSSEIHIALDKETDAESNTSVQEVLPVQKNAKRAKTNAAGPNQRAAGTRGGVLSPRSHNSRTLPCSPIKDKDIRLMSPAKPSNIARPVSPVKPISPFKSAASAASSAISASVHGMLESARQRGAAALSSKASRSQLRNTSKDSSTTMPPPASKGRTAAARTASQASNHSASTDTSSSSNTTDVTVVTKPKRSKTTTATTSAAAKKKAAASTIKTVSASGTGTLKKTASTSTKKTAASSETTGKRALRKRN